MTAISPPPTIADVEVRWLSRLLAWQIPLTAGIGLLGSITIIMFGTPPAIAGTAIVALMLAVLLWARALLRRGALGHASSLVCGVLMLIAPGSVLLIPASVVYLVLQPLLAVVITLPTPSRRRFRRTVLAAWAASISTVALGVPRLRLIPLSLIEYLLLLLLTASVLGLMLFLLSQYRTYLTDALFETRRSNVHLRKLRTSLEGEVQAHSDALRVSEARFQSFMNHIPAAAWIADPAGIVHYHNAAYPHHFLLPSAATANWRGAPLEIVSSPSGLTADATTLDGPDARAMVAQATRPDGSQGTFLVYTFPLQDLGSLQLVGGVAVDITARARAEQLLAEREERFRVLVQHGSDLIVVLDARGVVVDVTPPVLTLLGFRTEQVLGEAFTRIIHPDDVPVARQTFAALSASPGGSTRVTVRTWRADGAEIWIDALAVNLLAHPAVQGIVVNARDVTDQRLLEAQLQHAQRVETVGRLAGGVAHDFNNLLTAILGYTDMALDALSPTDAVRDDLLEVHKAAERGVRLTGQLLAFARKQVLVPEPIDLNELIVDLETMLRRLIGEQITLSTALAPSPCIITADRGQIEQVLVNLAVNARDAMPQGGELAITTAAMSLDALRGHHLSGLLPGWYALLSVSDTGVGMDAYTRERAFEPFFTTKGPRAGSGLGLAVCSNIVAQHSGSITCTSSVGRGTTVQVYLPLGRGAPKPLGGALAAPLDTRGSETVLVVEDEPAVLALATQVLRARGYTVLAATDGTDALRLLDQRAGAPVDLVVSDVIMPNLGGRQLAEQLRAICPELPILLMSGYTDSAIAHRDELGPGVAFLHKPFTPSMLARAVRELLDLAPQTARDGQAR